MVEKMGLRVTCPRDSKKTCMIARVSERAMAESMAIVRGSRGLP